MQIDGRGGGGEKSSRNGEGHPEEAEKNARQADARGGRYLYRVERERERKKGEGEGEGHESVLKRGRREDPILPPTLFVAGGLPSADVSARPTGAGMARHAEWRGEVRAAKGQRGSFYCAPEPGCAVASVEPVAALMLTSMCPDFCADLSPLARFFL